MNSKQNLELKMCWTWKHENNCAPFILAANNQENDSSVKVLRQKGETKIKNEKKNTETEIETKISQFFCDFQTVLLSEQEDVAVIPSPDFIKK